MRFAFTKHTGVQAADLFSIWKTKNHFKFELYD